MQLLLALAWIVAVTAFAVGVVILLRRNAPRCFSVSRTELILPHDITADELGNIEGGLPGLESILIVCNRIEDPAGKLDKAVTKNFKLGIPYTFLISPSHVEDAVHGYFQIFEKYAELEAPDTITEKLLSIRRLDSEWEGYPAIFYHISINKKRMVIAYRGTQAKEGIADRYELLDGHETAAILTAALTNATSLEEELHPIYQANP